MISQWCRGYETFPTALFIRVYQRVNPKLPRLASVSSNATHQSRMLELRGFVKIRNHLFKAAIMSNLYSLTLRHCGVPSMLSCVVTIYLTTLFGATAFRSGSWLWSISHAHQTINPLRKFTPSSGCSVAYPRQPYFGHALWTFTGHECRVRVWRVLGSKRIRHDCWVSARCEFGSNQILA